MILSNVNNNLAYWWFGLLEAAQNKLCPCNLIKQSVITFFRYKKAFATSSGNLLTRVLWRTSLLKNTHFSFPRTKGFRNESLIKYKSLQRCTPNRFFQSNYKELRIRILSCIRAPLNDENMPSCLLWILMQSRQTKDARCFYPMHILHRFQTKMAIYDNLQWHRFIK